MILINLFSSHLPAKCRGFAILAICDSSIYTHTAIRGIADGIYRRNFKLPGLWVWNWRFASKSDSKRSKINLLDNVL